jgi:hypothetical protein
MIMGEKINLVNQLYPATLNNDKLTKVTIKLLDQGMGTDVKENYGGASSLVGAPIGGAMPMKTLKMPNGPDNPGELVEDPTQEEPMTPTYTPGENFGLDSGSVEDVAEQSTNSRKHLVKQVFQAGKIFIEQLQALPDNELQALYQERPQVHNLMKQLHTHVNDALTGKLLDAPSHQAQSDYVNEAN